MVHKIGYCPWCNREITVMSICVDKSILWNPCQNPKCKGSKHQIRTDPAGFILEPVLIATRYIYGKNNISRSETTNT